MLELDLLFFDDFDLELQLFIVAVFDFPDLLCLQPRLVNLLQHLRLDLL